jgi:hypothetical protein
MAFGINIPVGFKLNNAGLHKAQKEFQGFGKSIKGALGVAGIAVGVGAVVDVLKESVKAAAMDAKSQKLLALQLKNTVHATKQQVSATEDYLGKLSMQVGIIDDNLRPALANAVRGTGSLSKGQKLLSLALDASAATGKPLNTVMQALIKAQNGQLTGLYKLAPELKKNKGNLDDFAKSVKGAAMANADPFSRLNVAMDNLKEQFGRLLLPAVVQFVDYVTQTVVPAVKDFLDQVGNPKTDAGKTFTDIKKAVKDAFNGVRDFFALFGNGDAMKGFGNVAKSLVQALPALLALKGIMVLASAGKTITNLVSAMIAIRGGGGGGGGDFSTMSGASKLMTLAGPVSFLATGAVALLMGADAAGKARDAKLTQAGIKPADYVAMQSNNPYAGRANFTGTLASYQAMQRAMGVKVTQPVNVTVNAYGSTPAEFGNLIAEAINRHNRVNGKK